MVACHQAMTVWAERMQSDRRDLLALQHYGVDGAPMHARTHAHKRCACHGVPTCRAVAAAGKSQEQESQIDGDLSTEIQCQRAVSFQVRLQVPLHAHASRQ